MVVVRSANDESRLNCQGQLERAVLRAVPAAMQLEAEGRLQSTAETEQFKRPLAKRWNDAEYRSFQQLTAALNAFIDRGAIDDYRPMCVSV